MSDTRHTPGPWMMRYGGIETVQTYGRLDDGRVTDGISIGGADRSEDLTSPTERDANVLLMAAAPELLEACKVALRTLHSLTTAEFETGGDAAARDALEAAILKAETRPWMAQKRAAV